MGQPKHTRTIGVGAAGNGGANGGNGGGNGGGQQPPPNPPEDEQIQWKLVLSIMAIITAVGLMGALAWNWRVVPWWVWAVLVLGGGALSVIGIGVGSFVLFTKPSAPKGMHIPEDAFVQCNDDGKVALGEGLGYIVRNTLTSTNKGSTPLQIGDTVFSAGLLGHPVVLVLKKAHTFTIEIEVTSAVSGPYKIVIIVRLKPKYVNGVLHPTAVKQLASYRNEKETWQAMIDEVITSLLQPEWANKSTDYVLPRIENPGIVSDHRARVTQRMEQEFGLDTELFNYEGLSGAAVVQATEDAGVLEKKVKALAPLLGGGGADQPQDPIRGLIGLTIAERLGLLNDGKKNDKN